ncbi:hypothetical protein ABID82_003209 [Methylobacterium sp. PvP062]|uniref:Uncharacterized protein n=1 Tax=Methylobacterium radiotolerans TaxID=31998 RepID=A0ABV2NDL0_9HYPH|nr:MULTISPECIES: hypothetical protein [unclassified Methylobacterium]MBP2492183.1 hypothetical protein [Methylobacterium sp. PvP105]MBP2501446.1 hypothetical protein [Methylobacterium sp. PvP109]
MKFRLPISSNQRRPLFANPLPGFDPAYYLDRNPDVRRAGLDPLQHFLNHGWTEGRDPSAGFSTAGYLAANPDVAAAGQNPLIHFLQNGLAEGRSGYTPGTPPTQVGQKGTSEAQGAPGSPESHDHVPLQGFIDEADHSRIRGWAFTPCSPNSPTVIAIVVNRSPVNTVVAGKFRPDLREANIGNAHHGFTYAFFPPLKKDVEQTIVIRRSADGQELARTVLPRENQI